MVLASQHEIVAQLEVRELLTRLPSRSRRAIQDARRSTVMCAVVVAGSPAVDLAVKKGSLEKGMAAGVGP